MYAWGCKHTGIRGVQSRVKLKSACSVQTVPLEKSGIICLFHFLHWCIYAEAFVVIYYITCTIMK
jgi:hypothetical protein